MKTVAAGIVMYNGKILIAQRIHGKSLAYKWEFPGGKLEAGETLPECLKRELQEELHLDVNVKDFFMETRYDYGEFSISLNAFWAESQTDKIDYMDSHEQIKWISPQELKKYDFAPADKEIIEGLEKFFNLEK